MTQHNRPSLDLSTGWTFSRRRMGRAWLTGRASGAADEVTVELPHSFNETDTFQYGVHAYQGVCCYRTRFRLPDGLARRDGRWLLCAGGFYGIAEVWLNGTRLGRIDGQYLGFEIDPGGLLYPDRENILSIRLDNCYRSTVLPGRRDPDFLLYGGLAGGMSLQLRPLHHIQDRRTAVICCPTKDNDWEVTIRAPIASASTAPSSCRLHWSIRDTTGETVARTEPVELPVHASGPAAETSLTTILSSPGLWSPEQPRLYVAEGRLEADNTVLDAVSIRFGLRTAEFRPGAGFFLNGERTDLHGCNRHESLPGLGSALPEELHRRDAEQLKQLGCNFVRLSHYPQHPVFLDACDELGLLVCAEVASWKSVRAGRWLRAARRQMTAMIERDRNHPSVILWSMGNESRSKKAYLCLRMIAQQLDPDRPVTYAENHLHRARRQRTVGIPDVWGNNYELDLLAETAAASRLGNVIMTECCNHPTSIRGDLYEELLQVATMEHEWQVMDNQAHLAGHAIWGFADYATEHRQRFRRLNGICDAWRVPKMAAALFAARFSKAPFIRLFLTPRFDDPRLEEETRFCRRLTAGQGEPPTVDLHLFSNCDEVSVCCDGGEPSPLAGAPHLVLPLAAAPQEIVATGRRGDTTATETLRAHGPAHAISLKLTDVRNTIGLRRTVGLDVAIRDRNGELVRDWNGHVQLALTGPARLRPYTATGSVLVARGVGRCFVTGSGQPGTAEVCASAEELESGELEIDIV